MRFPDEVVFEESIKEADGEAIMAMLRRASVDIDVNRINMAGMTALHQVKTGNEILAKKTKFESHFLAVMTALHQAVLDDNLVVVRLLLLHGARIDQVSSQIANGQHKHYHVG